MCPSTVTLAIQVVLSSYSPWPDTLVLMLFFSDPRRIADTVTALSTRFWYSLRADEMPFCNRNLKRQACWTVLS